MSKRGRKRPPPAPSKGSGSDSTALVRTVPVKPARRGATALDKPIDVAANLRRAAELAQDAHASNTRRAYEADLRDWTAYAHAIGKQPLPVDPNVLAAYIGHMDAERGLARSTIVRRCSALAHKHRELGLPSPLEDPRVAKVLQGLGRAHSGETKKKAPLTPEILAKLLLHPTITTRDKALLIVGQVTGMRRSELVAIRWADLEYSRQGIIIRIGKSKTDKKREGQYVVLPRHKDTAICPVVVLKAWKHDCPDKVLVFPFSTQTVADIVKRCVELVGEDPDRYGGHSFRSGMMTTASNAGVPLAEAMGQSRHKDMRTASGYARASELFKNRAPHAVLDALSRARTEALG